VRPEDFSRAKRREIRMLEAAGRMGLRLRQARRLWARYQARRPRTGPWPARQRRQSADLSGAPRTHRQKAPGRYSDFGPTMACKKLAEEGMPVSPDTLVAWLKERGLWQPKRRRGKHRRWREDVITSGACCRWMARFTSSSTAGRPPAC
jgi:hypothetical protein